MRVRKIAFLAVMLMMLSLSVSAQDVTARYAEAYGAQTVEDSLDSETRSLLGDIDSLEEADFPKDIFAILKQAISKNGQVFADAASSMVRLLLIVVLCQVVDAVVEEKGRRVVTLTGALAIMSCCVSDVRAVIEMGRSTVSEVADLSTVLLPVMVSAATASGSLSGSAAVYTLTTAFSGVLIRFTDNVLIPAVYAYLALALADAASGQARTKKLRELIGWMIEKGLKTVVYIFTGFLSVTGLLTGAADSAVLKATKSAVSGAIPVIGSIISGAADTVFSGAVLLKNAIGTFGMLSVFAIFIVPFLFIGSCYIMLKISAAISGIFDSAHSSLLEAISAAMGYILAMTASSALMALLSCCFFVKVVHI